MYSGIEYVLLMERCIHGCVLEQLFGQGCSGQAKGWHIATLFFGVARQFYYAGQKPMIFCAPLLTYVVCMLRYGAQKSLLFGSA